MGELKIGIFGTFDVQNYGDLLFPLLAEAELSRRLGPISLRCFSYHARTTPEWPYSVTSLTDLSEAISTLDGVLIGGGFIIRFDKNIAPGYGPPTPAIHHPTGYWLTPALMAIQCGLDVIWNAPGLHCNDIPSWGEPLLRLALENSSYIAVRDELSKQSLERFVDGERIVIAADTAFGIANLIGEQPSIEIRRLREIYGLNHPYVIVQAARGMEPFLSFVSENSRKLKDLKLLVLPIGPVLGDQEKLLGNDLPGLIRLPEWPHPLLIAELIRDAQAVIGHSYHLAVTAVAFGVPVFSPADLSQGKYTFLSRFRTVYPLPNKRETNAQFFIERIGKALPSQAVIEITKRLTNHWDHVAEILKNRSTRPQTSLVPFWQTLPILLDPAYYRPAERLAACIEDQERMEELNKIVALARNEITARDERINRLYNSPSMRVTTPLRFLMRKMKRLLE
jgi:lipopolysaccharide transport system ATP-binding protein